MGYRQHNSEDDEELPQFLYEAHQNHAASVQNAAGEHHAAGPEAVKGLHRSRGHGAREMTRPSPASSCGGPYNVPVSFHVHFFFHILY